MGRTFHVRRDQQPGVIGKFDAHITRHQARRDLNKAIFHNGLKFPVAIDRVFGHGLQCTHDFSDWIHKNNTSHVGLNVPRKQM